MKYLYIVLAVTLFNSCTSSKSQSKKKITQNMEDSAHYSNNQLAYIKKDGFVKFYDHKGEDEIIELHKNNIGYPLNYVYNNTGNIVDDNGEKMEYDDLGRLLSKKYYSGGDVYKSILCSYKNNQLIKSIHKGKNNDDNFIKEYQFNDLGKLTNTYTSKEEVLISITKYNFNTNQLLELKKEYRMIGNSLVIDVTEYSYNNTKQLFQEKTYTIEPSSGIVSLIDIKNNNYDKTIYSSNKFNFIVKEYSYNKSNLVGFTIKDIARSILKANIRYEYNSIDQLTKIIDLNQENSETIFSYQK